MTSEARKYAVSGLLIFVGLVFALRLLYIQVFDPVYKKQGDDNIKLKMVEYPYRGLILDRNQTPLVVNEPVFDLTVVPKDVKEFDTLTLCNLLSLDPEEFKARLEKAKDYSSRKASPIVRRISRDDFARIEEKLIDFPGFYPEVRTQRAYPNPISGLLLGFVGEISAKALKADTTGYYRSSDMLGRGGLERFYEKDLRGHRGVRYKIKNAYGVIKGSFAKGAYDTLAVEGRTITTTIDLELQEYAEKLMEGKVGSLVAIEPSTGEILSYVSAPAYDPRLLTGRELGANYQALTLNDSTKPLFNRPVLATYPPGSTFKTIQALMALQEGVVGPREQIFCDNSLIPGHSPQGSYDVVKGLQFSSNDYFARIFKRVVQQGKEKSAFVDASIGMDVWADYARRFGLGGKLGVDLYGEKPGNVPNTKYYDKRIGRGKKYRWKASNVRSISIGQGEVMVTPLQMANVGAIMANRGYYYTPHIIKNIGGDPAPEKYRKRHETGIRKEHYEVVVEGMRRAVGTTAFRALIPDIEICGKTGTAQNPHGHDHSAFMAFAPRDNPKIAIAVYMENVGYGGRASGSIASLLVEKYIKGEVTRPWLEKYVLESEYLKQLGK
ncbi:penicillin-binding protein 2 [Fulvitalea axinellae]|uniref:Penicillin-binding protein 2 n=1 Tax=Fulvitalea axinellae TaxID=1182444 RepID=A0AAU9CBL7_9BACT|nr:penicillin-binding protein 2 [Fulvitalea axinellae]